MIQVDRPRGAGHILENGEEARTHKYIIYCQEYRVHHTEFLGGRQETEEYLKKYVEVSSEIAAMGILGEASLELGMLYKKKGQTD